jgi:hypothetical protein
MNIIKYIKNKIWLYRWNKSKKDYPKFNNFFNYKLSIQTPESLERVRIMSNCFPNQYVANNQWDYILTGDMKYLTEFEKEIVLKHIEDNK